MSAWTRRERTEGMNFSLFFVCWSSSNYLKDPHQRGVHYKSLYLMLDGHEYLNSFYVKTFVMLVLFLVSLSELSVLL